MTMTDKQQETTFDFGDGKGPVPAKKHPNGGGWVANTALVARTAFVGPRASVGGEAYVGKAARIADDARVWGSATVTDRAVVFEKARVAGNARVSGDARISGAVFLSDNVRVSGGAEIFGEMELGGADTATRTPLSITGPFPPVTVSDHSITAGCQTHSPSMWKQRGAAIIKANGRTLAEAKYLAPIVSYLADAHGCVDP
ncbi:hypothetical protein [Leisingera caerulea]|uniref:Polymer-forming cytoskeletal protein n=1 Tax=Leisingera caerulea TaxID=506591 RepID=A0A9Q9LW00_LEICA|nr:hypothetical protein [Leisingera caerulea]UWQ53105.1 hypothetical protein K3721_13945 [Leisingera caerulea]